MLGLTDLEFQSQVKEQTKTIELLQHQNQLQQEKLAGLSERLQASTSEMPTFKKSYVIDIDERLQDFIKELSNLEAKLKLAELQGAETSSQLELFKNRNQTLEKELEGLQQVLQEQDAVIASYSPEELKRLQMKSKSLAIQNKILTEEMVLLRQQTAEKDEIIRQLTLKVATAEQQKQRDIVDQKIVELRKLVDEMPSLKQDGGCMERDQPSLQLLQNPQCQVDAIASEQHEEEPDDDEENDVDEKESQDRRDTATEPQQENADKNHVDQNVSIDLVSQSEDSDPLFK